MYCKFSKKKINPFMRLGKMPIANGFIDKANFNNEFFYELEVGFSEEYSLFQLNEHTAPEKMFNDNYPFFSSSSEYMKKHFSSFASYIKKKFLNNNSKLIEIGSNDGTMLKNFDNENNEILGFEPSKNVAQKAIENNVPTLNLFFNKKNITDLKKHFHNTDVICASNVICHIPDLNDLIEAIDKLLSKNGVFIFEEPYLDSMFDKISYDQIYDEHIYMFSVSSVLKIFKKYDFVLVDAIPQQTHGGSMRYVIKRKKNEISQNLNKLIEYEKSKKIDNLESCLDFKKNCENSKKTLLKKLNDFKNDGKKICGYAATSKSTTILNYCKIGNNYIEYICDTTKEKIGKFSPGMHIPIVDMNHFKSHQPDCIYLFAWNHKNEILSKEKNFKGEWFSHVAL